MASRRSAAVLALSFFACTSGGSPGAAPKEIQRTDLPSDLSGQWNDVDADLVASAIIDDCLKSKWIEAWSLAHDGKKPQLRLFPIRNRTTEYIDYRYFTKQIEAALVRSGQLEVLAASEESRSSDGSDGDSDRSDGDEAAATNEPVTDFLLNGWIVSQEDRAGDQEVRAYLTSIEVIEAATQKKAWVGQKRIRKLIKH